MKKPILVVMAAGMGSRYGGLKQMDPIGPSGEVIIDYSIYDARRAGFETVVFIIKEEIADTFREIIGDPIARHMDVRYAYQNVKNIPAGYEVPEGRVKPWGTAHAILSAGDVIDAPFAVINADDFYGASAFQDIFNFLNDNAATDGKYQFAMAGYLLGNTVTEHGHVARGVCQVDQDMHLESIVEHTRIETYEGGIHSSLDDGETWEHLPFETIVSMNLWGFPEAFVSEIEDGFPAFLDRALMDNPAKAEYFLPEVVRQMIDAGKADVTVLVSRDKWYGVTYKEDKPVVEKAIRDKIKDGDYPEKLWD